MGRPIFFHQQERGDKRQAEWDNLKNIRQTQGEEAYRREKRRLQLEIAEDLKEFGSAFAKIYRLLHGLG